MSTFSKFKRAMRGEVSLTTALLEGGRRSFSAINRRNEQARLQQQAIQPARLTSEFASLSPAELLTHFRDGKRNFFPGFEQSQSGVAPDKSGLPPHSKNQPGGVAVFLFGLKNGVLTTRALTRCRTASTVISNCTFVPGLVKPLFIVAKAIIFFKVGDQVLDVALPTCRPS